MSDKTELTTVEDESTAPITENTADIEVRDFDAVSDDHPLVEYAGQAAMQTDMGGQGKLISELIYQRVWAWTREWLQNHETACIRASKLLIRLSDKYADGWLTHDIWVSKDTGETIVGYDMDQQGLPEYAGEAKNIRKITVPRPVEEVLEAARGLGYDPTIEWDVYHDERKITTEDNGIGMTPREFWEAFERPQSSGSDVDGETGGQFGVGSESVTMVCGDDAGIEVESCSRRPGGHEPYRAYSYMGGATAIPGELDESFRGTRFHIPVKEDFKLNELQEWVEHYTQALRVPVLYREHNTGEKVVEEEYEATSFRTNYNDPPIQIHRPGEFTIMAGPEVIDTSYNADDEDTFLVSMPIDRNTSASINTFWEVAIQINDEQGRIISGPNRGRYREDVDSLDEDDVVLPEPTVDRDRFNKDSKAKEFFNYIEELVKFREMSRVNEIVEEMVESDHPADAIKEDEESWILFKEMVDYHGSWKVTDKQRRFRSFIKNQDTLPDIDNKEANKIFSLFKTVGYCHRGAGSSAKKSSRSNKKLGQILAEHDREKVYMAASTGGKFTQRFKVLENTDSENTVITVNGCRKYDQWGANFGFKVLKNTPLTDGEDDDHEYDVPDRIHEENINNGSNLSKADTLAERSLKIRNDGDNSSIDLRVSISDAKDRLENGMDFGHEKLVLFQKGKEKISENYNFAKYAAIASVSKTEYEELSDYDDVMTPHEFKEWSASALIATEDGPMTPEELVEDDRMVVLTYYSRDKDVLKLLKDENEELRNHYCRDVRGQIEWATHLDGYDGGYKGDDIGDVPDSDKPDTLFALGWSEVLDQARWKFNKMSLDKEYGITDIAGLNLERRYKRHEPADWTSLDKRTTTYRLMVDTPNWDNSSDIYNIMPSNVNKAKAQMFLGLHDRGIDPTDYSAEELRDLIGGDD